MTALAGVGPPVAVASAASTSPPLPRVMNCNGKAVVKPGSYVIACADANIYFADIHWTSWGTTSAKGSGTYVQNTCTPTCAAGRYVEHPGRLMLSKRVSTRYGLLFSVISYNYTVSASTTLPLKPLPTPPSPSA